MTYSVRPIIATLAVCASLGVAQTPQSKLTIAPSKSTISEPGVYRLSDLFAHADRVALVRVTSGDTETYDVAIYRALVVKGFKGLTAGETIYFGPYIGTQLGSEYILFLRDSASAKVPKSKTSDGYGTVRYSSVFDEGYSSMLTSYECVFEDTSERQGCDYGVRVCTDYIKLPKSLPAFPRASDDTPFGCRWVRKSAFISFLDVLAEQTK